jgi:hypothetical protein
LRRTMNALMTNLMSFLKWRILSFMASQKDFLELIEIWVRSHSKIQKESIYLWESLEIFQQILCFSICSIKSLNLRKIILQLLLGIILLSLKVEQERLHQEPMEEKLINKHRKISLKM